MALNFPTAPALDETFTDSITTWKWNGTAWIVDVGASAGANTDTFATVTGDTGTTTANSPTDSLAISGGTNIVTSVLGDVVTISVNGDLGTPDQNLFATFNSDAGSVVASTTTDALTVAGSGTVSTAISGNTLTINGATPTLTITQLTDVDTISTPPIAGNVLKWDGNHWAPGADATTGGAGTDADTLDGFNSSYFLNYNNFSNTPTIPADVSDLTDTTSLLFDGVFGSLTSVPTTVAGYGITDAFDGAYSSLTSIPTTVAGYGITDAFDGAYGSLTSTPTTIAGYGITDALSTSSNLSALADVSAAGPSTGQALIWDGAQWGPDSVSGGGGDPDQNLWATFFGDAGSTTANSTTDSVTIKGGSNISTTVTDNQVLINMTGALGVTSYNALSEVVTTGRTIDKSYMPAFAMIRMTNSGNTAYTVASHGYTGNNPTLIVIGGMTVAFDLDQIGGHPFEIQDGTGTAYNTGLVHVDIIGNVSTGANANGQDGGTLYWEVPETISGTYRYQCTLHASMVGAITVKRLSTI
jgi:plastocyanin|tara:strand:+ start:35618 stop:37198 length:1581 start_codon:yes stop_codon:yes gene_type:complete